MEGHIMTRRSRIQAAFRSLTGKEHGGGIWFVGQCGNRVSQSAIYRWRDGSYVRGEDLLEGVLRQLEADAELADDARAQAEAILADLKRRRS